LISVPLQANWEFDVGDSQPPVVTAVSRGEHPEAATLPGRERFSRSEMELVGGDYDKEGRREERDPGRRARA
jgi:hypothetical protein